MRLIVQFHAHIDHDRVAGMVSGIAAYGNVTPGKADREFEVEVFRKSNFPPLERQLVKWDEYGFLTWSTDDNATITPSS